MINGKSCWIPPARCRRSRSKWLFRCIFGTWRFCWERRKLYFWPDFYFSTQRTAAPIGFWRHFYEKISLAWLRRLALVNAGVWLLYLASFVLYVCKIEVDPYGIMDYVFGYAMSVLVYAIGYKGLKQPEIFSGGEIDLLMKQNGKKYERSSLTPEMADDYAAKLQQHMDAVKPFKNAELTLPELAAGLAISPNHLSQIINEKFGQNFFDFINGYRLKEAERALLDPDLGHLTILAIAYEAGFNSKSAFNVAFKKYAEMTPSQFRKLSHRTR